MPSRWFVGAAVLFLTASPLQATTPGEIGEVIACLKNKSTPFSQLGVRDGDWATLEIVRGGRRYTISYSGTYRFVPSGPFSLEALFNPKLEKVVIPPTEQKISVIVQPNAAIHFYAMMDLGTDGTVNTAFEYFTESGGDGTSGKGFSDGSDATTLDGKPAPRGLEFRAFWEQEWEKSTRDILAHCRQ